MEYNVVYASDNNFVEIMGVSIVSLLENNKNENLKITILSDCINVDNKRKIEAIVDTFDNCTLKWVEAIDIENVLGHKVNLDRGSVSQYARIFISEFFDNNISRILYLDSDTLVVNSIVDLWNIDLQEKTIGAMKDAFSKYYRKNIGLNPNDIMFNSGVMIIDLDKWRSRDVENRVIKFIESRHGRVQQGDQGALNAVLSNETFPLNPKYNVVSIFSDFSYQQIQTYRKPINFYTEKEIVSAVSNPVILHYTSNFFTERPWYAGSDNIRADKWLEYRNLTPWKEEFLFDANIKFSKKIIRKIYKNFSQELTLRLAAIFQIYLRPLKNRLIG